MGSTHCWSQLIPRFKGYACRQKHNWNIISEYSRKHLTGHLRISHKLLILPYLTSPRSVWAHGALVSGWTIVTLTSGRICRYVDMVT